MDIKTANKITDLLKDYEIDSNCARQMSEALNEVISYAVSAKPHPKMTNVHIDKMRDDVGELKILSNVLIDIADCMDKGVT